MFKFLINLFRPQSREEAFLGNSVDLCELESKLKQLEYGARDYNSWFQR